MKVAQKILKERKEEIEEFFEHLLQLETEAEEKRKSGKSSEATLQETLKATSFLLLYNLVESTLTQAINAIYDDLKEKNIRYSQVTEKLQERVIKNLSTKQDVKKLQQKFTTYDNVVISGFDEKSLFSGNIDAKELRKVAEEYGFSYKTNRRARKGAHLLTIKTQRNKLAHGDDSFSDTGRNYTIQELKEIKDSCIAYLEDILKNIDKYIDEQDYLIKSNNF